MSLSEQQAVTLAAWNQFVDGRGANLDVPPLIAASWKRCWARVNPRSEVQFVSMSRSHLLSTQVVSFDLISVARPILEDVFQCVDNPATAILLANNVGCLLDVIGGPDALAVMDRWNTRLGTILTEEMVGTNSLGLALIERMAVQVVGTEHYVNMFHNVAGAAAPIFDPVGHLLGVLGIMMPLEEYHVHSMAMVVAGARAIESQCQADFLLDEQNSHLSRLNAVLSAISDGILVWSADRVLMHANPAAGQILNVPVQSLLGKQADTIITLPRDINDAITHYRTLSDVDTVIRVGSTSVSCVISLNFVFQPKTGAVQWVIVTLRPEKQVRKLVQRQVGASAPLTLDDIPGDSPQIHRVRHFVRSVAPAKASVLIRGEAGTGKNALASAVHNAGPRRDGPFLIFACASVPTELIMGELLGYEGATGGPVGGKNIPSRPSKFELAQGGTLFFQDVDMLSLEAQAVLLNVLELGVVQRLGSQRPIEVDTRIVASTCAPMEDMIVQGSFRPDLFYRLSTFSITIPPVRERPQDIPAIVDRILKRLSLQLGHALNAGPGVVEALKKYPWNGNIREIEAILGRLAVQTGPGGMIELEQLPTAIQYVGQIPAKQLSEPGIQSLDELERDAIVRTAQLCRGNVTLMAQALGMGRTTLWRRMKIYRIDPQDYRRHV